MYAVLPVSGLWYSLSAYAAMKLQSGGAAEEFEAVVLGMLNCCRDRELD